MRYTAGDRTPYTYVIRFPALGVLYYGAQWGRGCHPDNLGTRYFSSSTRVKKLLKLHEAVFEPRKTFSSADACRDFETRFLRRVNAKKNPKFMNTHNNEHQRVMNNEGPRNPAFGKPGTMLGRKHRPDTIQKMREVKVGNTWNVGKHNKPESNRKSSESQRGEKSWRFEGWYHTPHGVFASTRLAEAPGLNRFIISRWCRQSDRIISQRAIAKSSWLQPHHVGLTLRQLGFWFQPA